MRVDEPAEPPPQPAFNVEWWQGRVTELVARGYLAQEDAPLVRGREGSRVNAQKRDCSEKCQTVRKPGCSVTVFHYS